MFGADSYQYALTPGFPGMRWPTEVYEIDPYYNGEPSARMPFGIFVAEDLTALTAGTVDPRKAKLIAADTDRIAGIIQHSHAYDPELALGKVPSLTDPNPDTGLVPGAGLIIGKRGRWCVLAEGTLVADGPVYVRFAANGARTQLGAVRGDADDPGSGATAVLVKGARVFRGATAGGVAWIDWDRNAYLSTL